MKTSTKQILIFFTYLIISILIFGCSNCKNCYCLEDNEKIIQSYESEQYSAKMIQIDNGAFGETCRLVICNQNGELIEKIGLRGETDIPKIEKIDNNQVFIFYSYKNIKNENLKFESVVLGEKLLNNNHMKFNYHFENRN